MSSFVRHVDAENCNQCPAVLEKHKWKGCREGKGLNQIHPKRDGGCRIQAPCSGIFIQQLRSVFRLLLSLMAL